MKRQQMYEMKKKLEVLQKLAKSQQMVIDQLTKNRDLWKEIATVREDTIKVLRDRLERKN